MAQSTSATDHLNNAIEAIKKGKSLTTHQKRAVAKIESAKVFLANK